jgi:hypothetical protein
MEANPADGGDKPIKAVTVVDCGELTGDDKVTPDPELIKTAAAPAEDDDDDEDEEEDEKEGGQQFAAEKKQPGGCGCC